MFKPGELVFVRALSTQWTGPRAFCAAGGIGLVVNVVEEHSQHGDAVHWYDVFIDGRVVCNIIDIRIGEHVSQ